MAAPVPQLNHDESHASSLIDVDSPHVSSVTSDWQEQQVKTETQAQRLEREAEAKAERAAQQAQKEAAAAKEKAASAAKKAKSKLRKEGEKLSENRDNPVVIGNAVLWTVVAAAVGFGVYQKHSEGKLDWKVAGTFAGGVAAIAAGDYFASQCVLPYKYTMTIADTGQMAVREQVPYQIDHSDIRDPEFVHLGEGYHSRQLYSRLPILP